MAAVASYRAGEIDNAFWLAFLSVHVGRHASEGWLLASQIYGGLGPSPYWDWDRISGDPKEFRDWLASAIRQSNRPLGKFGNHRKYETLDPKSRSGAPSVFQSYVDWVRAWGGHQRLIEHALKVAHDDPKGAFAWLYRSMDSVLRFGRLAKFDYLTLVGKLGLAPIAPDSTYMSEATGPLRGARLLFDGATNGSTRAETLEGYVRELDGSLSVGLQAMEDSLCNWQKSPTKLIKFRG